MSDLNDVFQKAAAARGFDLSHLGSHVVISGVNSRLKENVQVQESHKETVSSAVPDGKPKVPT